jgi:Tol biopolymer transport system component
MPHYAPDGQRLTYLQGGSGGAGLAPWVMNADGTGQFPLVTDGGQWGWPSWAPDGTRVLLARDASEARRLWWVDLTTRNLTRTDLGKKVESPRL